MLARQILKKRGVRNDALWTRLARSESLAYIPLAMDTAALQESQYWPRESLEAFSRERSADILRAARSVPFWKERLETHGIPMHPSAEHIALLPLLSRRDFSGFDREHFTDASRFLTSITDYTSGSTGTPFQFFFDRGAVLRSYAMNERHFLAVGDGKRYPVLSLRARPKIGFTFRQHHHFYVRGSFGVRARFPVLAQFMDTLADGCILYSFPSLLVELARAAEEQDARFPIRAIISSGEAMTRSDRTYVESVLGARVSNCYGTRELGALGFECGEGAIHINEEWARFEIVDERGTALPDGSEGRIVVTTFDNRVMPFIRYNTGDMGRLSASRCACGRTLKTLSLSGRQTDRIALKDGRLVSLLDITPVFDAFFDTVRAYQIVQRSPVSFVVRVIPGPKFEERCGELRFHLLHALHAQASVEWDIVSAIEPSSTGKAVYFVKE